jgi:hypothetical protein
MIGHGITKFTNLPIFLIRLYDINKWLSILFYFIYIYTSANIRNRSLNSWLKANFNKIVGKLILTRVF